MSYARTLDGHTNILIYGSEVLSGCKINADGTDQSDAIITVDFGQGACTSGHSITLNEGSIEIDGHEIVSFGSPFKDIAFMMSNCDDQVYITETFTDLSSVEVIGYDGDDTIELGSSTKALDTNIFSNIIIDGGGGSDSLTIYDQSSSSTKPDIAVRPTSISGIHGGGSKNIAYFAVENINMSLGTVSANVTVFSTAKDASLTLTTQGKQVVCSMLLHCAPILTIVWHTIYYFTTFIRCRRCNCSSQWQVQRKQIFSSVHSFLS